MSQNELEEGGGLSYTGHLEILRRKAIFILVCLVVLIGVSFFFIDSIMAFLQLPLAGLKVSLNYFKPYEKFVTYMKVAFFSGLLAVIPIAIAQFASFIYPALYKNERRWMVVFLFLMPLLFVGGFAFSYFFILPAAFNFFLNFAPETNITPILGMKDYFEFIVSILLVCGILFQYPLVLLFLIKIGVLNVKKLAKGRRYAIIILAVIAAAVTPPDVVSQVLVGIPLYLLFELTLVVGRFIGKKKEDEHG